MNSDITRYIVPFATSSRGSASSLFKNVVTEYMNKSAASREPETFMRFSIFNRCQD